MVKIGVIGVPGGWSSERLADAVKEKTGFRLLIDMSKLSLNLERGDVRFEGVDIGSLDALIIKKIGSRYSPDLLDRLEMLRFLAEKGLPIFSSPLRIIRVLDRLSCTVTMTTAGIPMPPTTITEDIEAAIEAVYSYGAAVFKPLYSTKARGMTVIEAGESAPRRIEAFKNENPIMYLQKKMDLGGKDFGIVFLGGEYLTTYARITGQGAWNTTTQSGGRYAPYAPSSRIIEMAERAQALFGLDFTCVDVAETARGPVVFEVSAFGGFRGIAEAAGIDAAERYVRYVLERIPR